MVHAFEQALADWSAEEVEALSQGLDRLRSDHLAATGRKEIPA
jgi:hypothetical protein